MRRHVAAIFRALGARSQLRLAIPWFLFLGLSVPYNFAQFTRQVPCADAGGAARARAPIGRVAAVFAGADAIGALLAGRAIDRAGAARVLAASVALEGAGLAAALAADAAPCARRLALFYAAAALLGLADACAQTGTYAMIMHRCGRGDQEEGASAATPFSAKSVCHTVGNVAGYVLTASLRAAPHATRASRAQFATEAAVVGASCAIGFACLARMLRLPSPDNSDRRSDEASDLLVGASATTPLMR